MKRILPILALVLGTCLASGCRANDSIVLTQGATRLEVMVPDAPGRFYRGTRFDPSSIAVSWTYAGTTIFAPWRLPHDPGHPESAAGFAEEFGFADAQAFAETPAGGPFLKIGVGVLRRPDDKPYDRNLPYELLDAGHWETKAQADGVAFRHVLDFPEGNLAYIYEKRLFIEDDGRTVRIWRCLANTGGDAIATDHYGHNFLRLAEREAHTGYTLEYPSPMIPKNTPRAELGAVDGSRVALGPEAFGLRAWYAQLVPADPSHPMPGSVLIRHPQAPLAISIETDKIPDKVVVFALAPVVCPEFFIPIRLAPGEACEWSTRYGIEP